MENITAQDIIDNVVNGNYTDAAEMYQRFAPSAYYGAVLELLEGLDKKDIALLLSAVERL